MTRARARRRRRRAPRDRPCRGTARRTASRGRRAPASTAPAPCRPSPARRARRAARAVAAAPTRPCARSPERTRAACSFRRGAEREHVLIAQERLALAQLVAGRAGVGDHLLRIDALVHGGSGSTAVLLVIDDPDE